MCTVILTPEQIDRILDQLPVRTNAEIIIELLRARGGASRIEPRGLLMYDGNFADGSKGVVLHVPPRVK